MRHPRPVCTLSSSKTTTESQGISLPAPGSLRIVACFLVLIGLISALLRQVARRVLHPFDGSRISMNRLFVQTFLPCGRGLWQVRTPTASVPSFGARTGTFNPIRTLKIRARKWQTQLISTLNLTRMKERWARIGARLIRYRGRLNGRPTGVHFWAVRPEPST